MIVLGIAIVAAALAAAALLYMLVSHDSPGPYGAERAQNSDGTVKPFQKDGF